MTDPQTAQASAMKLADLTNEIEEVEASRLSLIVRLETLRASLLETGNRTATIRASLDFLAEHLSDVALARMGALEAELREVGFGLEAGGQESRSLLFESGSIEESITDAEDELENLSQIILNGKAKTPRGH